MGNEVIDPPEVDEKIGGVTPSLAVHDVSQGLQMFEEESTFASLFENLRDAFFPPKLPPLELTSKPIPVVDRMAVKRDPVTAAISAGVHILLAGLIAFLLWHKIFAPQVTTPKAVVNTLDLAPVKLLKSNGGGGGGSHEKTPPTKGAPPPPSKMPITPPTTHLIDNPKLAVPATMDIPKMNSALPNIGDPHGTTVGLASNGTGGGAGIGNGNGHGIGNGNGEGMGPCNAGDNCFGISGVDKPPVPIYQPEPEFSEEARKVKQQGMVGACMWVNANGTTSHIQIVQPLGFGLDEEAKKSLATWKFKPASKDGHAVTVSDVCVYVNFRMY